MYRWWLSSCLTLYYKLVYCRDKTDQNARKSGSKKTLVSTTLHLVSSDRFKEGNTQNLTYQCITHFCVAYSTTYCCDFFLCNEVRKIKPSCNPETWTLGRINLHSFNNVFCRFSGTRKSNKSLILTITVHQ